MKNSNNLYYSINSPTGEVVDIPISDAEDPYLKLTTPTQLKDYYEEYGYVIKRNAIPKEICDQAINIFNQEVKPFNGYIYRQASANLERHIFTEGGHMLNSILNVQSLDSKHMNEFRTKGIEVLTNKVVQDTMTSILEDKPKLVQSMFFDGNPITWAHQDTYYLDSENFNMAGAWFALEDIEADAGRFYIYPKSHKIDVVKNGGNFDIAFNHDRYKKLIIDIIKNNNLELSAPKLNKGDILIWNSKTIHGCLETIDINKSRKSFTGHFIPQSENFIQYQSNIKKLNIEEINGMQIHFPKDLNKLKYKLLYNLELKFPKQFRSLKNFMIKRLVEKRSKISID